MSQIDNIIAKLGLRPLPSEGGYFARTWTGPSAGDTERPSGTAIYFLLTRDSFSAFHRLESDEIWHYYAGTKVEHWRLAPTDGAAHRAVLGPELLSEDVPQLI